MAKSDTKPKKDTQSRKWQITVHDKELDREKIKAILSTMKSLTYWCMADEIGGITEKFHTHVFFYCRSPMRFTSVQNKFPKIHVEQAFGSCIQNRDYLQKGGKWANTDKAETSIPGSFEEWGDLPSEHQGQKPELAILYDLVKSGYSNYEIIEHNPDYLFDISKIDMVRLTVKQEEYKNVWRDLETYYIFGKTGSGKTRGVMEMYGYENVFRVTDYMHPFDTYKCEDVIIFEEFNSSLKIQDILVYLDGYPCKLPCRYSDKIACFTKIYILSNIPLEKQYPNVKDENMATWLAFIRRIHMVVWYKSETEIINYDSTDEYFNRDRLSGLPIKIMNF